MAATHIGQLALGQRWTGRRKQQGCDGDQTRMADDWLIPHPHFGYGRTADRSSDPSVEGVHQLCLSPIWGMWKPPWLLKHRSSTADR